MRNTTRSKASCSKMQHNPMENAMRCFSKGITKVFAVAALMGGLFFLGNAHDANAQMMGGHRWTPAVQTTAPGQAWQGHGPGQGRGHNGTMHGYARVNTAAGYHNGHGPHGGSYGGCGW